jgi:hypothetical protein
MFPDGNQILVKSSSSWSGLIPYTKYLKEDYEEDTKAIVIKWCEAIKFLLKGRVFDVGKLRKVFTLLERLQDSI